MNSAETYPMIAEAIATAAMKLLEMPERLEAMDKSETSAPLRGAGERSSRNVRRKT